MNTLERRDADSRGERRKISLAMRLEQQRNRERRTTTEIKGYFPDIAQIFYSLRSNIVHSLYASINIASCACYRDLSFPTLTPIAFNVFIDKYECKGWK